MDVARKRKVCGNCTEAVKKLYGNCRETVRKSKNKLDQNDARGLHEILPKLPIMKALPISLVATSHGSAECLCSTSKTNIPKWCL